MKKTCVVSRHGGALAVLLCFAGVAAADDLLQVYEAARLRDPSLQSAVALVRSAEPRAAQADALLLPNVALSAQSRRSHTDLPPGPMDPAGANASATATGATLTVRQPLFNRVASADVARSRTALELARSDFDATQQDFILRVAQAYFDVLSAQDVLTAAQSNKESLAFQLGSATRNFEVGTGIVTDVRDAQARYDLAVSQELAADNELRLRRLALARLAGKPVEPAPLKVPVTLPPIAPGDVRAWMEAAAGNPDIRRARLAHDGARTDVRRAKAARLPTVDVVGSVARERNTGAGATLPGNTTSGSIGVELNVPIFSGFATRNRIAETVLLEEKAREDVEAARRTVAEATERAFFDLQTAYAQVKALEAAEASSRLSLEGTQLGYRSGVRLNLDVLNAQTLLFQTQRDLAKARNDALMGHLKLRRVAGGVKYEDLAEINRLVEK